MTSLDYYKGYAHEYMRMNMSSVVSSSTHVEYQFDSADNILAMNSLVALFVAKGDTHTATRIIQALQKED